MIRRKTMHFLFPYMHLPVSSCDEKQALRESTQRLPTFPETIRAGPPEAQAIPTNS